MKLTQKKLNRLYNQSKSDSLNFYKFLTNNLDCDFIKADLLTDIIDQYENFLKKIGYIILKDPIYEGSDTTYSYVIVKNKNLFIKDTCYSGGYIGTLKTTHRNIVKVFGDPNRGVSGDNKVSCGWDLFTPDKKIAITLYDYKTGIPYLKEKGKKPEDITIWHIGSNKKFEGLELINTIFSIEIGPKNFQIID